MLKKESKERKRLVVEEVETPVGSETISSSDLQNPTKAEDAQQKDVTEEAVSSPSILDEAITEEPLEESKQEEIAKEIHAEEKRLHDIHTGAAFDREVLENPQLMPEKKSGNPIWWILIPGIFILGALLGGIIFYQKGIGKVPIETPTPEATPEAAATPIPTPLAKADLAKYPINVENGSGIPGTAASAKTLLESAGFSVDNTGNADNYNYTDTIIETKSDVPGAFITQLTTALSGVYKVGTPTSLPDSSTDEVVVIIGSSKSQ